MYNNITSKEQSYNIYFILPFICRWDVHWTVRAGADRLVLLYCKNGWRKKLCVFNFQIFNWVNLFINETRSPSVCLCNNVSCSNINNTRTHNRDVLCYPPVPDGIKVFFLAKDENHVIFFYLSHVIYTLRLAIKSKIKS